MLSSPLVPLVATLVGLLAVAATLLLLRVPGSWLLAAYAFVIPWGSSLEVPGPPAPFDTVSTLVGVVATVGLGLALLRGWRRVPRLHPSVPLWVALAGWLALTLLWSVDLRRSIASLAVLYSLVVLFVLGSMLRLAPAELRRVEVAALAGGLVVAAQALAAVGGGAPSASESLRFAQEGGDPNIVAATLLLPLALAVWWSVEGRVRWRRIGTSAASAALLSAIVVTGSRGGLVAALVVLGVVAGSARRVPAGRWVAYVAVLLVILGGTLLATPDAVLERFTRTDSTGRTEIWRIGLQACASMCDVGSGYGTFPAVYRETFLSELGLTGFGDRGYVAHNVFLSMVVEGGVPALLLMLLALAALFWSLLRLRSSLRAPALAALCGVLTSNLLISNFGFKYFWFTLLYATLVIRTHSVGRLPPEVHEQVPVARVPA